MKKNLLVILMGFIFLINYAENLDSLSIKVNEKTTVNKREKNKEYSLEILFPDKLRKVIYAPSVNKGEIYKYNGKKKEIYYPLFEEYIVEDINDEENYIIKFFNELKLYNDSDKDIFIDEGKKISYNDKSKVEKIEYDDGSKVIFQNYKAFGEIFIPQTIKVYENDALLSDIKLSEVKVNIEIEQELFDIEG